MAMELERATKKRRGGIDDDDNPAADPTISSSRSSRVSRPNPSAASSASPGTGAASSPTATTARSSPTRSPASSPTTARPSTTSSSRFPISTASMAEKKIEKIKRSTALFLALHCPSCLDSGPSFPRIAAMAFSSVCVARIPREMNLITWSATLPLRDGSSCPRSTIATSSPPSIWVLIRHCHPTSMSLQSWRMRMDAYPAWRFSRRRRGGGATGRMVGLAKMIIWCILMPSLHLSNGMVNLISFRSAIIVVDTEGKKWKSIPFLEQMTCQCFCSGNLAFIGQSQGHLYYINSRNRDSSILSVWTLDDYCSCRWSFKYNISTSQLFGWTNLRLEREYNLIAIHPECNMIFYVSQDESQNTLLSYDMDRGDVNWICNIRDPFWNPWDPCLPYVPVFMESLPDHA